MSKPAEAQPSDPLAQLIQKNQFVGWLCHVDYEQALVLTRDEAVGQSFNIGSPRSTVTIHQLARDIVRLAGSTSELQCVPWNFPDVELRVPDISKARKLLSYEPLMDLEEGLARTIAWYKEQAMDAPVNTTHA